MNRILLNSSGGIHIDDSKIVILPTGRTTESCECCGPPQPPPPDCTRCFYGEDEDGLPVWGAGVKKDFALQIASTTDQIRRYIKIWFEHKIYNPPDAATGAQPCGCEFLRIDYEYELILNGFAALNGTYYGRDAHSPAAPAGDIQNGIASSVAGCTTSGDAFDPTALSSIAGCLEADPCNYFCEQRVWIKDIPITGTITCTRTTVYSCNGVNIPVPDFNLSANLSGYAYIQPIDTLYSYDPALPPEMTIGGIVQGVSTQPYGPNGHIRYFITSGDVPLSVCNTPAPTINTIAGFRCPGNNSPVTDLSCYPFWRQTRRANAHTCNEGTVTHAPTIIDRPACDHVDQYETPLSTAVPGCFPLYSKGYIKQEYSAFYSEISHLWTNQ